MKEKHAPIIGAADWFTFQKYDRVERIIADLAELGIKEFRTSFSWADWSRGKDGAAWFDWYTGKLRDAKIRILPCLFYTPPDIARRKPGESEGKTSYPPERLEDYAHFTAEMIDRYGDLFDWVQIWNEPNWRPYWDWDMDPGWKLFATMAKGAIDVAHAKGKKCIVGGLTPLSDQWIVMMLEEGFLRDVDAFGLHASPGSWPYRGKWCGWEKEFETVRLLFGWYGRDPEIWITETGYSTFGEEREREERMQRQIAYFDSLASLPAQRIYWYSMIDQHPDAPTDDTLNVKTQSYEIAYHFGIRDAALNPKPLFEHWKEKNAQ